MKKTIAAILSAALAVIPTSNALTANAATAYNTDRTYVILARLIGYGGVTSMPALDIRQTRNYLSDYSPIDAGTVSGTIYNYYGGGTVVSSSGQASTYYKGAYFRPSDNDCGTIMSFTCTNSSSSTPEQLGYTTSVTHLYQSSYYAITISKTVRLGDISAYITSNTSPDYNGITAKDALLVHYLINYFGNKSSAGDFSVYDKVIDLSNDYFRKYCWADLNSSDKITISGTQVAMKMVMNALLASDINNDGYITPTDAAAIRRHISDPDRYPNLAVFNGMSDLDMAQQFDI